MTICLGKSCFFSFTVRVFLERLSNSGCVSFFSFGIEGGMWDVIVLIPSHYLSIYFSGP